VRTGTAFALYYKVPWQQWSLGYVHGLPALLLLRSRTRALYHRHRDSILLMVHFVALVYQHWIVQNYMHLAPVATLRNPAFAFSFTWLPTAAILYQMKFAWQVPMYAVMTAVNISLVAPMCTLALPEEGTERCGLRMATKTVTMVAAALLVVYCVEWRARRVWLMTR
jgi:hypothetical protein